MKTAGNANRVSIIGDWGLGIGDWGLGIGEDRNVTVFFCFSAIS
jgi:hypothetical protein